VPAAIVFGHDFDVFVPVASVQFVFDAEVREVDRFIEVRQVVVVRPFLDFARVPIRSSVTVGSPAVVFLEPLLILALELVVEDDPTDVGALVSEPRLFAQVRPIKLDIGDSSRGRFTPA
jgi:hypothetical protein